MSNIFYNYFIRGERITISNHKLKILDLIDAALYLKNNIYCKKR